MARTREPKKSKVVVKEKPVQDPNKQDLLIDQLEGLLSGTVSYVVDGVANTARTAFTQPPKKSLHQAKRFMLETVPSKVISTGQSLKYAYDVATMRNIKSNATSAARCVKSHPYTSGLFGFSLLAGGYMNPLASAAIGVGLIGKTIYDHGGLNIEVAPAEKVANKPKASTRKPK